MMIGEYPCCGAPLMIPMPDETPAYGPDICTNCGAKVWHLFSRIDPQSWTEEDFLREHEVDENARTVRDAAKGAA